jgi:hypothetical protein
VSAYRVAIDQTTRTIDSRAKNFRNLIVAVVTLSLGSMGWAIVMWTCAPFAGLFLFVPICGFFFFFDQRILTDWRSHLLEAWVKKDLDLQNFCEAVSAISILPKGTLQSMLATLPSVGDLIAEQGISSNIRKAIAALVMTIHACRADTTALKATGFAIVGASLMVAAMLWMWQPLLGVITVASLPFMRKWMRQWRLKNLSKRTLALQRLPDYNHEKYLELIVCLPWEPMSTSEKDELLNSLSIR